MYLSDMITKKNKNLKVRLFKRTIPTRIYLAQVQGSNKEEGDLLFENTKSRVLRMRGWVAID